MPNRDSRIDDHIGKAGAFARPILEHFRATMHRVVPECEEAIKWGMPHFTLAGRNLAGMAAFKKHVSIFFHHEEDRGGSGKFRQIASLDDLPSADGLEATIRVAVDRLSHRATLKQKAPPKPVPEMPQAFAVALAASGHQERFEAMPPGYRREYIEWIAEAKTDATRGKRIAQSIEWIGEGKHRNWKYNKC